MTDLLILLPLTAAAIEDGRRRIISNWCPAALAMISLPRLITTPWNLLAALLVGGLLLLLALRTDGVGGGDIKLCAALALTLGTADTLTVLLLATALLILFGISGGKRTLPFAPFLLPAYLIHLLLLRS